MKKRVIFSAMLFLLIGLADAAQAQPWDYNADYPTATGGPNPNGVWTYGYLIGGLSNTPFNFAPANDYHPAGLNIFWGNDSDGAFGKNPFEMDIAQPGWPDGMFFKANSCYIMTPSSVLTNKTAAAFTAPQTGNYTINALFQSGVMNDTDTEVGVIVEGVWVYTDTVTSFQDMSSFDAVVALEEGQRIYFALNNIPGEGGYNGGFHIITFNTVLNVSAYDPDVFPPFNPDDYPIDGSATQPADPNDHTPRYFIPQTPEKPIATSWDYNDDFPLYTYYPNPNGVWTYGYYQGGLGAGYPYAKAARNDYHPAGISTYFGDDTNGSLGKNFQTTEVVQPAWPDGMYFKAQRPYLETPASVLSNKVTPLFTAPYAGVYQVDAFFESGVMDGWATDTAILLNGGVLHYDRISGFQSGPENIFEFSRAFDLAEGDTIGFAVNNVPGQGGWNGGFHIIDFNASVAITDPANLPEPLPYEMLLWLKADAGVTTSEGVVTAWADQSTSGLTASLDTGNPMLETGSFNNGDKPVIRFDGDDALVLYDLADPENILSVSSFSIYVVGKIGQNQVGSSFIADSSGIYGWNLGLSASQMNKVVVTTATARLSQPTQLTVDKYYLIACTVSDDYERKLYINGNLRASDIGSVNYGDVAAIIGNLLVGDIAEIQVYQGTDEDDHAAIQAALIDKYALLFSCADQGIYFQTDINEDCYVNLEDIAILAGDWLKCNDPANPDNCDPIPAPPLPPLPLPDPELFAVKTWDYNADYPTATGGPNPNGQWYYGYLTNAVGNYPFRLAPMNNYHPVPPSGNALDVFWGNDTEGAFGKNPWPTDSDAPTWPNGMYFPADSTYLMSPATLFQENKTTARFVTSFEATYEVQATFESGVMQGFDTPVYVLVNGVTVFADTISGFQDNPANNIATFSAEIALPQYGILDFVVDAIPGEGNTEPGWPNGGFHIVTFDANITSSAYNAGDFPVPFDPADYPLDPNMDPNHPVLIPMSPLQDPEPAPPLPTLPREDTVYLTGLTFSDTNPSGTAGGLIWNTLYNDAAWDLAVHAGTIEAYDPNAASDPNVDFWLNNDTNMMIDIPLVVGNSYDFTIHKPHYEAGGPLPYVGLNLYFDGLQAASNAGISVYAANDTTGPDDGNPAWFAKDGPVVTGWPFGGSFAGGGQTYRNYDKLIQATITHFVYYETNVYNVDSISAPTLAYPLSGPDGTKENIMQIRLVLEPFIPTCEEQNEYYDNDFNVDCYINLGDYAEIAGDWLKCNDPEIPTCTDVPN